MEDRFIGELRSMLRKNAVNHAPLSLRSRVATITCTQPRPSMVSRRGLAIAGGFASIGIAVIAVAAAFSLRYPFEPFSTGATSPISVATQAGPDAPSNAVVVCRQALSVVRIDLADSRLVFTAPDTGEYQTLVFPAGFAARLVDGHAELLAPDGTVAGREGETITVTGGLDADGTTFIVCSVNGTTY